MKVVAAVVSAAVAAVAAVAVAASVAVAAAAAWRRGDGCEIVVVVAVVARRDEDAGERAGAAAVTVAAAAREGWPGTFRTECRLTRAPAVPAAPSVWRCRCRCRRRSDGAVCFAESQWGVPQASGTNPPGG